MISAAELIINDDGSVFHLHIKPGELAENIILVGDPSRVDMVALFFDKILYRGASREFVWATGEYNGKLFTALSTGIGTDNIDIVMTELDALVNVDFETREVKSKLTSLNIVRLGTSGTVQSDILIGDFVLSTISIGLDPVAHFYEGSSRVRDLELEHCFADYMQWGSELSRPYAVHSSERLCALFSDISKSGITFSAPGFYAPQGRKVRLQPVISNFIERLENFSYGDIRATNIEMESSALAFFAAAMGHQATTMCLIVAQRVAGGSNPDYHSSMKRMIQQALERLSANL